MFSKLLKISAILFLALAVAQPAFASITLTLSSGNTSVTIADNDPLYDTSNTIDGLITTPTSLAVGGWSLNIITGISQPPLDQPAGSLIFVDLTSTNMSNANAASLRITFETGPFFAESQPGQLASTIGGTLALGASITARQYIQIGAGDSARPVVMADHGTLSTHGFSSEVIVPGTLPDEFYVKEEIILTPGTGGGVSSFNFESRVMIPEPFSVVIWSLLGLTGAGLTMVRRRKLNARTAWSKETRDAIYKAMKL